MSLTTRVMSLSRRVALGLALVGNSLYGCGYGEDDRRIVSGGPSGCVGETCLPDVTRKEGSIAFVSDRSGSEEIYTVDLDGSNLRLRQLTNNGFRNRWPDWSPDGTEIAFSSDRHGNFDIYVMGFDGSPQSRVTDNPANESTPVWSPDGTQFAFVSDRDGNAEIYVMDREESNPTNITNDPHTDGSPSWLPDGTQLIFVSDRDDGNPDLYIVNADGSGDASKLFESPARETSPSWAPSGEDFIFNSNAFKAHLGGSFQIYLMNYQVRNNQIQLTYTEGENFSPAWCRPVAQITFFSLRDGNEEIYLMDADGTDQRNLTKHPARDYSPSCVLW